MKSRTRAKSRERRALLTKVLAPHMARYDDRGQAVKCPRCWQWTIVGRWNFDGLCDRCCHVIRKDYPQHESVPFIRAAYRLQEEYFRAGTPSERKRDILSELCRLNRAHGSDDAAKRRVPLDAGGLLQVLRSE